MTRLHGGLLSALGWPWGAIASARRRAYTGGWVRSEHLSGPVVSVGNIAVGGRGKTPVVLRVCQILQEMGATPAVLSRGYGGTYGQPALLVSEGTGRVRDAAEVGDEAAMLARALPGVVVAVGRRRVDAGRLVETRWGPRVHVLDDGFQHLGLARDLDIVCIDARDLEDRPLPAGRLRERPAGLARAQVALLSDEHGRGWDRAAERVRASGVPTVLRLGRQTDGVVDSEAAPCPPPRRPFLVAGIADPQRFEADAHRLVGTVAGAAIFRDHHRFVATDVERIEAQARAAQADAILTTAKDLERLRALCLTLPVRVLRISAAIEGEQILREVLRGTTQRLTSSPLEAASSPASRPVSPSSAGLELSSSAASFSLGAPAPIAAWRSVP
jgi:tetraacyldisaccharide 4'-kinase